MTKLAKSKEMIMNYAINNQNKITKREAVEYIGYRYDSDTKNHVGRVLSKLVKEFKLTRIRNGNFEVVPDRETVLTNALKDCLELLYECNPPVEINNLFIGNKSRRGDYPIGVFYDIKNNKFTATYAGKNLGRFNTAKEAFLKYKEYKENRIEEFANKFKDTITLECYNALLNYKVKITD